MKAMSWMERGEKAISDLEDFQNENYDRQLTPGEIDMFMLAWEMAGKEPRGRVRGVPGDE